MQNADSASPSCHIKKFVKQILVEGDHFDVMSVRRWRDRMLNEG
jgi:hypothetical protein